MKYFIFSLIASVVIFLAFAAGTVLATESSYRKGFEDGTWQQVYYVTTFPTDGFMSYSFRKFLLKQPHLPTNNAEMKITYARYYEVPHINLKDTTGLQSRIDSSEQEHYKRWLVELQLWKDSIDKEMESVK